MPTLTLTDEQVVELVRQLSPERKRAVLLALAEDARAHVRLAWNTQSRNCGA